MSKRSAAANVIDLEAFRQRKIRGASGGGAMHDDETGGARDTAMLVPVWVYWVPFYAPGIFGGV